ncbi:nuclease-related domain-containing protein [Sporosarcina contaminans]|uniref:Nuclease-related domain-containing protein n=1 Tax=Sporosarcina contaminans TaxID=633403 RepID=A0ABW3TUT8_9BACL
MLYKKRTMPNELKGLLSLTRRLPASHEKQSEIQKELYQYKAGYEGEQEYDKYMTEFTPAYPHAILHDLYLKQNGFYFQIDSLLITPSEIVVTEVKNYSYKTVITSSPTQFIKVYPNGDRKVVRSPIVEVERKIHFLQQWLKSRNIDIPISGLIIFKHDNEIEFQNSEPEMKIAFTYEAPSYFRELNVQNEILKKQMIAKLSREMLQQHKEYTISPLTEKYGIDINDITPGVICPNCDRIGMQWAKKKWNCAHCQHSGQTEHQKAVEDWFLLIQPKMTNREFRYFTKIDNRHVARGLLAKTNLQVIGERKAAHYIFKKEFAAQ